jgi:hypothetical protein
VANSATHLDLVSATQASKEVTVNAALDSASPAMLFGRRATTCALLTWGYHGGVLNVAGTPAEIGNGTVSLTPLATNYVEATTAGVVSANTSGFTAGRLRLYTVVTGASTVSSYTDHRHGGTSAGITGAPGVLADGDYGDVTVSSSGSAIAVDSNAITYAKMQDVSAASKLLGRGAGSGSGDPQEITLGTGLSMSGTTLNAAGTTLADGDYGDVTVSSSGAAIAIDNDVVTYAKMQNVSAASKLIGRGDSGSGDPQEITVGSGLTMTGTTLSASGGSSTSITGTTGAMGGNATVTGGTSTTSGNAGGQAVILGGTPGATGTGGAVSISGATGGSTSGAGGSVNIAGGNANAATTVSGGSVNLTGGSPGGFGAGGFINLAGGSAGGVTIYGSDLALPDGHGTVTIRGGKSQGATLGNVIVAGGEASNIFGGGTVLVQGGDAAATGGAATVRGGDGISNGSNGGVLTLRGGDGARSTIGGSNPGGALNLRGGDSTGTTNTAAGGAVSITGGFGGAGNANGGNVSLAGGAGGGTGAKGNVAVDNGGAISTSAVGGFFCIPTCAGAPTGTPANVPSGAAPLVIDTTNGRLYAYYGAAWHQVTLT